MNNILNNLLNNEDLSDKEMRTFMHAVMKGEINEILMGAILIALHAKGETPEEIIAAVEVMREFSHTVSINQTNLVDIVGTGGDGQNTFNISTTSAFVAASAGVTIAKHGNRSASSKCGSADVLEAAGVNLDLTEAQILALISDLNIGFLFAPNYHPALKNAKHVRTILGIKALFNLLGPLTNPANALRQVVGVYHQKWVRPIADVLKRLGAEHAMVVHSHDGMDEISIFDKTQVAELKNGNISEYQLDPKNYKLAHPKNTSLVIHSIQDSLKIFNDVLQGIPGEAQDIVILNAGAAIYCSDLVDTLEAGFEKAKDSITSKKALHCFEKYKERTQHYAK